MAEAEARNYLLEFTGVQDWVLKDKIEIFDAAGPLLFEDYIFQSALQEYAWVRLMPAVGNQLVSVERGRHPAQGYQFRSHAAPFNEQMLAAEEIKVLSKFRNNISKKNLGLPIPTLKYSSLYCYHYPNLAVLVTNVAAETVFQDIIDNKEFSIREMGSDFSESRDAYSFFGETLEKGEPGDIKLPEPNKELSGTLFGQEKGNWCAAASCKMVLAFHGVDMAESDIAARMGIPPDEERIGAKLEGQLKAFSQLIPPGLDASLDTVALAQSCIDELAAGRPLKLGIVRHAQACFGWTASKEGQVLYRIYDPMPVGHGSIKLQNPSAIWTQNHIFVRPKQK